MSMIRAFCFVSKYFLLIARFEATEEVDIRQLCRRLSAIDESRGHHAIMMIDRRSHRCITIEG